MPQKSTKKQCSKGKGKNEDKVPEPSIDSIGVRECLVWNRGGGDSQQPAQQQAADDSERETKFLMKKGQLGKPVDRGYVFPEATPRTPEDEGTVIEALRGWPGLAREAEECENGENQDGGAQDAYISGSLKKGGSGKGKKGSGKKGGCADDNGKGDPPMVYLVAHKYLSDFERKKMEEEEEERQKERAKRRPVDFAAMSEQKGNKTSKLRSIHLANQTPVDPKDLWKMKKFSNAKSHLDTFRKNEKNQKKGKKQNGQQQADGNDCTCGLNLNTYLNNGQPEAAGETQPYSYDYDPVTTDRQPFEQQVDFYNYDK